MKPAFSRLSAERAVAEIAASRDCVIDVSQRAVAEDIVLIARRQVDLTTAIERHVAVDADRSRRTRFIDRNSAAVVDGAGKRKLGAVGNGQSSRVACRRPGAVKRLGNAHLRGIEWRIEGQVELHDGAGTKAKPLPVDPDEVRAERNVTTRNDRM